MRSHIAAVDDGGLAVMSTATRWGGLALFIGSIMVGAAVIGILVSQRQPVGTGIQYAAWVAWLLAVGAVLTMLALPHMYAVQANQGGTVGTVGFALLQGGWVLALVFAIAPLVYRGLPSEPGESVATLTLGTMLSAGFVLTSVATIRAGVFPAWIGYVLLAAAAGFIFLFFVAEFLPTSASRVGGLVFGSFVAVGWAAMGMHMWMGSNR